MEEKKKNVTIVFDRKKRCAKTGKGKVEIVIYFRHNSRKYIVVGEGTPANWETVAQNVVVQDKVREYEPSSRPCVPPVRRSLRRTSTSTMRRRR